MPGSPSQHIDITRAKWIPYFANTNFSSNLGDLRSAAAYLRENYEAPRILIGHSLGGAAVIAAAGDVPEAAAVVTIGAPADPAHVAHHFQDVRAEINERGEAEVQLGGRPFRIQRQFLEDIETQNLEGALGELRKALLVFHAPRDATVGVENAGLIFQAAKHPKSFVSLDDADHLLSRREDAIYVADIIAAWTERYLGAGDESVDIPSAASGTVVVAETGTGRFSQNRVSTSLS